MKLVTAAFSIAFISAMVSGPTTGMASYYGYDMGGKKTASGELFDPNAMTAASKTLPMGTVIDVKNLDNQKTVRVIVNDRGPYAKGRIIDLSRKAAEQLDMIKTGVAMVEIKVVNQLG